MPKHRLVNATPGPRKAPRVVVLAPSAFADTWGKKPDGEVAIGLRLISSSEVQAAKGLAAQQVAKWYARPEGEQGLTDATTAEEAYNDAVVRHCVARATCRANDVEAPYFEMAEDTIREQLTEEAIRRLWDELLVLHASSGVAIHPASDEDIKRLARILLDGSAFAAFAPDSDESRELRTLFGHLVLVLTATGRAREADVGQGGGGDGGYVVRVVKRPAS